MTTVNLTPNADISRTGVSTFGTGTYPAHLTDSSDSTGLARSSSTNYTSVGLSDPSPAIGANDVIKQARINWRGSSDTPTTASVSFYLSVLDKLVAGWAGGYLPSSPADYSTSWWTVNYQLATQQNAADLRADFMFSASGTNPKIMELDVDLVYVEQPVCTVTAVTDPYEDSTLVPISWTNTLDSDGGAQTRWQAYVTDDNDGDATVYNSGEVLGIETSTSVGPLPNGDYTVHVRSAQTVNGATHWSAYDTDSFTVSVTSAEVDTVTTSVVDAEGRIAVRIDWDNTTPAWQFIEVERQDTGIPSSATDFTDGWQPVRGATAIDANALSGSTLWANWNLATSGNANTSGVGVFTERTRTPGTTSSYYDTLYLNDTDSDAGDQSTPLAAIAAGDVLHCEFWSFLVESTQDNSTHWQFNGTASGTFPAGSSKRVSNSLRAFVVQDYEAPNGRSVQYRARATAYSSGLPITGAWVTDSSTVGSPNALASTSEWIKDVVGTNLLARQSMWSRSIAESTLALSPAGASPAQRSRNSGVFAIIGSDFPAVVSDVLAAGTGGGTLTYLTSSLSEKQALEAILTEGSVLAVNLLPDSLWGPNSDGFGYIAVTGTQTQMVGRRYQAKWATTVQYIEVDRPPDSTVGSY